MQLKQSQEEAHSARLDELKQEVEKLEAERKVSELKL
jgi:polyhydroxyalkanoate synthesis regulator phasin